MVLLAGNGLTLRASDDTRSELNAPGDLLRFDGATRMQCELSDGPCTDLNLMVADSAGPICARVQSAGTPLAVRDAVTLIDASGNRLSISAWDTAVCNSLDGEVICSSDTAAARACIASF